jgi:hypothetical protein
MNELVNECKIFRPKLALAQRPFISHIQVIKGGGMHPVAL